MKIGVCHGMMSPAVCMDLQLMMWLHTLFRDTTWLSRKPPWYVAIIILVGSVLVNSLGIQCTGMESVYSVLVYMQCTGRQCTGMESVLVYSVLVYSIFVDSVLVYSVLVDDVLVYRQCNGRQCIYCYILWVSTMHISFGSCRISLKNLHQSWCMGSQ